MVAVWSDVFGCFVVFILHEMTTGPVGFKKSFEPCASYELRLEFSMEE